MNLPALVPIPVHISAGEGCFTLGPSTTIGGGPGAEKVARYLRNRLQACTGHEYAATQTGDIQLEIHPSAPADEGYRLEVSPAGISLKSQSAAGLFYGVQTLLQLMPSAVYAAAPAGLTEWTIPSLKIEDAPAFSWRGSHLDVGRHFMPIEFLRKYIDLLAMHKMNTLHLHLTEDQGWRMEIKKYPELTERGAWRKETIVGHARESTSFDGVVHGGFYTQDQLRELVAYAAERFITIVPEIDMPGHMQAAVAAYPDLGNSPDSPVGVWTSFGVTPHVLSLSESAIQFMKDVLTEVMDVFPSRYIHIGGDECPTEEWEKSEPMQALMAREGIEDVHHLQAWLNNQLDEFLQAHGRTMVGWDEILEGGLAPGAVVMSWRGEDGGIAAANAGHDVVMTPGGWTYFDHYQSEDKEREPLAIGGFTDLEKVYGYHPVPGALSGEKAKHVLGSQFQIWTEYMKTSRQVEYMAYPRACALAEVLWASPAERDFAEFTARLSVHLQRLDRMGVNYRPLSGPAWPRY